MSQELINGYVKEVMTQNRSIALIAMGSNQKSATGDAKETLAFAREKLLNCGLVIRNSSQTYRTPAFPTGSGPDYANAVISVECATDAHGLLRLLHAVEEDLGRVRSTRWGPRVIDLDLLAFDDLVLPSSSVLKTWIELPVELQTQATPHDLILPHPRLQDRAFVLIPLAEIAPDWRHPMLGKTVRDMVSDLPDFLKEDVVPYQ